MKGVSVTIALLSTCLVIAVDGAALIKQAVQAKPKPYNDKVEQELAGLASMDKSPADVADPLAGDFGYSPEALEMIQYLITRIEQSVESEMNNAEPTKSEATVDDTDTAAKDQPKTEDKKNVEAPSDPSRHGPLAPTVDDNALAGDEMPRFKSAQEAFDDALLEAMKSLHVPSGVESFDESVGTPHKSPGKPVSRR